MLLYKKCDWLKMLLNYLCNRLLKFLVFYVVVENKFKCEMEIKDIVF